ncbi:DUF1178 family protein [Mongoliimonas terrestris]|uniref:DUF1178 family protein n=1 Tax=Mongoliimonas terrestris TaxID=1709001 RepID=UPI000949665A|nr:DUF1178 family protein [Mongoliimonas terrestris]
MIRYALVCDKAHGFDAWFRSAADFDTQAERGLLSCPHCGSVSVAKGLMTPQVRTAESREKTRLPPPQPTTDAPSDTGSDMMVPVPAALATPEGREILGRLRALKAKLIENSENVGAKFAEEARRIHYGEAPERPVHGQATVEEARALVEEGVGILPLPVLPDEQN